MKKLMALALLTLTVTSSAFADFVPGRIRATSYAKMQVIEATGAFEGLTEAVLYRNTQDEAGFVSLTLKLNSVPIQLPITSVKNTGCGNFAFSENVSAENSSVRAEFVDYSFIACRIYVDKEWKLKLEVSDKNGGLSTLSLEGEPKGLFVTL